MPTIGRRTLALEYVHAGDGKAYRHDFTTAAELEGNADGSVTLRSTKGKRLWKKFLDGSSGTYTLRPFLENPPMRNRKHRSTSRRRSSSSRSARGRGAPRRKSKRPVPSGFASWKTYMAHLRNLRSNPAGGSMSKRRRRRRSNPPKAANPPRHRRRRRSNPPGIGRALRQAPTFAIHVATMAVASIAGKIAARKIRGGVLRKQPGTLVGSVAEAAVGLAGGLAISMFSPVAGEGFAIGGVSAPVETFIQQRQITGISDALGDDGYFIGGNSGIGLISAFPDDYRNVVGDVGDVGGLGRFSGYVGGGGGGSDVVQGYLDSIGAAGG